MTATRRNSHAHRTPATRKRTSVVVVAVVLALSALTPPPPVAAQGSNAQPAFANDGTSFNTGSVAVRGVLENSTSGNVGDAVAAADANGDTLTYSAAATSDSDGNTHLTAFNRDFAYSTTTGQITVKATATVNFEQRASYKVKWQVSDSKSSTGTADTVIDDTVTLTIQVFDVAEPTLLTVTGTVQVGQAMTFTVPTGTPSRTWEFSVGDRANGAFGSTIKISGTTAASLDVTPPAQNAGKYYLLVARYSGGAVDANGNKAAFEVAGPVLPVGGI